MFEALDQLEQSLIAQAAEALDRAEEARREIALHGVVDRSGRLARPNPAVAVERDAVRLFLSTVRALKLEPEVDLRELEGPTAPAQNLRRR